jgi:hypothetical protein
MEETTSTTTQPEIYFPELKKESPWRPLLIVAGILLGLFIVINIITKKEKFQENIGIKAQIDSLAKVNAELQSKQATLDSISKEYELHLDDLDWKIDNVGEKKTIIREYYYDRVKQPKSYTPKQIDSFFKNRYNY